MGDHARHARDVDRPRRDVVREQFTGVGGDCISTGFGSVWLSNHELGNVWRLRPR